MRSWWWAQTNFIQIEQCWAPSWLSTAGWQFFKRSKESRKGPGLGALNEKDQGCYCWDRTRGHHLNFEIRIIIWPQGPHLRWVGKAFKTFQSICLKERKEGKLVGQHAASNTTDWATRFPSSTESKTMKQLDRGGCFPISGAMPLAQAALLPIMRPLGCGGEGNTDETIDRPPLTRFRFERFRIHDGALSARPLAEQQGKSSTREIDLFAQNVM